jgi:hypothetical protein
MIIDTMKRTISLFLAAFLLCAGAVPAFGWGQKGHRVIAQIAYDNLTKKARKAVDKTLGKGGIVYWANWPDEIKSDTIYPNSYDWHFQDFDGRLSDEVVVAALTDYPKEGGNLFRAMDSLQTALMDYKTAALTDADRMQMEHTLRFVVHLAGDRYCPMHTAHMDDRGGNDVKMKWFKQDTRLHTVWDEKLVDSQGYSFSEYAQKLETEYANRKKEILAMSEADLLLHNYHFTEAIYAYQATWDGNTYHYIYRWRKPMEEQLYIAGIRLAKLLNEIYK